MPLSEEVWVSLKVKGAEEAKSQLDDVVSALQDIKGAAADDLTKLRELGIGFTYLKATGRDVGDMASRIRAIGEASDQAAVKTTAFALAMRILAYEENRAADAAKKEKDAQGGGFFSGWGAAFKNLFSGWGNWSKLLTSGPGIVTALTSIAVAVGILVNLLVDLAQILGPLAFGLGSFAAFAYPTVSSILTGYTAVTTAQDQLAAATTKNAKTIAEANLDKAWKSLDPGQRGVVKGMIQLSNEFGKLAKKFEPDVLKLFNMGLKVANKLLPEFFKIAIKSGPSILKFFGQLAHDMASPQFQHFLDMMMYLAPKAIETAGHWIFKLTDWVIALARWIGRVKTDMGEWLHYTEHDLAEFGGKIISAQMTVATWGAHVILDLGKVAAWFWSLPIKIGHALANLKGKLFTIGVQAIEGLIGGISSMGGPLQSLVGKVAGWILGPLGVVLKSHSPSLATFAIGEDVMQGLMNGMSGRRSALQSLMRMIAGDITGGLSGRRNYGSLLAAPAGAGGTVVVVNFNGVVGDPHRVAMEIQQLLIGLKRNRYGPASVNVSRGLGLA